MSIIFNEKDRCFEIQTENTSYFMKVDKKGLLRNLYWGKKIHNSSDLELEMEDIDDYNIFSNTFPCRSEYICKTGMQYEEPCIDAEFSDGTRDVRLVYSGYKIEDKTLRIRLRDEFYSLEVELAYSVYKDLISKHAVIRNYGDAPVKLTKMKSASAYPTWNTTLRLMYMAGNWGREYQKNYIPIEQGLFTISNRRGNVSGPQHVPFFAIDCGNAAEDSGSVWYGVLHWSGNFKIDIERDLHNQVIVTAGVNDYDCEILLNKDESFETPVLTIGFSDQGYEKMSEELYDYQFDVLAPQSKVDNLFPMIYNTWYPYELDVNEDKCLSLINAAKKIDAELFVIDDGWQIAKGNWHYDPIKFPRGLKPIADSVHQNGMKFGLWIEPETCNENVDLIKVHPEWILKFPNRSSTARTYALDLSRKEVMEYIWETVDRLIDECDLDYLKWDMNFYITESGSDCKKAIWVKHINNLYEIWRRINEKYPHVLLENCAHGGARADYGMVKYSDRINRSDNADPIDVLKLHEGFSTLFLPKYAGGAGNLATSPNGVNGRVSPLKYRAYLGMTGSMSVGVNLLKIPKEEIEEIRQYVNTYKEIRNTTQNAYVYRLSSSMEKPYVVWEYLRRDRKKAVIFVFSHGTNFRDTPPRMKLRGLSAYKKYKVSGEERQLAHWKFEKLPERISAGDALMNFGIRIEPLGDYYCQMITVEEVE